MSPRSQRPFYHLIVGVLGLVLLFFGCIVGLWVQMNYQAMSDARKLEAAGFQIISREREQGLNNWLVNLENDLFPPQPPRHWTRLHGMADKEGVISADEMASILARQRSLETVFLPGSCVNEEVLKQLVKLPKLTNVWVEAKEPMGDAWLEKLRSDQGWVTYQLNLPGLSPAGAAKLLQACPNISQLGLPDDAIDEANCDTILSRASTMTSMDIYFDQDGTHSPAAIRLAENFSGRTMNCIGRELPAGGQPSQPLIIRQTGTSQLSLHDLALLEVHATTVRPYVNGGGKVLLTGATGRVLIRNSKQISLLDSPLAETVYLAAESAEIARCNQLTAIIHMSGTLTLHDLPGLRRYVDQGKNTNVISQLANCPNLFSAQFTLDPAGNNESLEPLAALPELQTLVLRFDTTEFTHPWFAELEKLPHLKTLILLQADHKQEGVMPDWSTFNARFPPDFQRVIIACNHGPEITTVLPDWQAMTLRYAGAGVMFEARYNSPWDVPEQDRRLVRGP